MEFWVNLAIWKILSTSSCHCSNGRKWKTLDRNTREINRDASENITYFVRGILIDRRISNFLLYIKSVECQILGKFGSLKDFVYVFLSLFEWGKMSWNVLWARSYDDLFNFYFYYKFFNVELTRITILRSFD